MIRILPFLLAGCVGSHLPPAVVPVAEIKTDSVRATATHIGNGIWMTCRHVLERTQKVVLQYHETTAVLGETGPADAFVQGDWVIFHTEPPVVGPELPLNLTANIAVGEEVFVAGYGWPGSDRPGQSNLVKAEVTAPIQCEGDNVLHLCFPQSSTYPGLSGAAVIYAGHVVAILAGRMTYGMEVRQLAVRPVEP